ncbi:gsr3410 [Gloeobacter violaceus PCC 7421]|uniref:Gsr3410 protein n=1 Tax=Gloeobacter violaceus (strain ATCC 29082 / PCC 7421) TaxID=251221 RepID=Q7NFW4_GLOVI|nr:gsr3410 [Gloeobacter violaceus PCC 7421]
MPNLVIEIKSITDRLKALEDKLERYLALGAEAAILVDPDRQTLTILLPGHSPRTLLNGEVLTLPQLLPGWELEVSSLWPEDLG